MYGTFTMKLRHTQPSGSRRLLALLYAAILLISLPGCEVLLLGSAAVATYEVVKDERTAQEVAVDTRIVADVKQKLIRDRGVSGWDINVDSYQGEVTLNGNVPSQDAKERAILLTKSVKGVAKIVSKLVIVPTATN